MIFFENKQYELAVKCFEKYNKLEGWYAKNMLRHLGISYDRLGNIKAAVEFLILAIYNNPADDIESFRFLENTIKQSFNFSDFYSAYRYLTYFTNSQKLYNISY